VVGQSASVVATDGTVTEGPYPETKAVVGGFSVVDVPSREAALEWAAKISVACRCAQEVRSSCPTRTSDRRRPTAARPLPRVFQRRRRATQGIRNVPLQALATVGVAAGHGRRRCYRSMAIRMGRRRPPRFGVHHVDVYVHACWAGRSRGGAGGLDHNAGGRLAQ
jgi:YCII-related domain